MENEQDIESKRADAVEELRTAFAELESGEGLTRLVGGHGIQRSEGAGSDMITTVECHSRLSLGCG